MGKSSVKKKKDCLNGWVPFSLKMLINKKK